MNWKRCITRNLLFSVIGAVAVNLIYFGLLFTALHGFAVMAIGPATQLVINRIDPNCYRWKYCFVEEYAVNIALYTFAIFVLLSVVDVWRQSRRRASA